MPVSSSTSRAAAAVERLVRPVERAGHRLPEAGPRGALEQQHLERPRYARRPAPRPAALAVTDAASPCRDRAARARCGSTNTAKNGRPRPAQNCAAEASTSTSTPSSSRGRAARHPADQQHMAGGFAPRQIAQAVLERVPVAAEPVAGNPSASANALHQASLSGRASEVDAAATCEPAAPRRVEDLRRARRAIHAGARAASLKPLQELAHLFEDAPEACGSGRRCSRTRRPCPATMRRAPRSRRARRLHGVFAVVAALARRQQRSRLPNSHRPARYGNGPPCLMSARVCSRFRGKLVCDTNVSSGKHEAPKETSARNAASSLTAAA